MWNCAVRIRSFAVVLITLVAIGRGAWGAQELRIEEMTEDMLTQEQRDRLNEIATEIEAIPDDKLDPATKPPDIAALEAALAEIDKALVGVQETVKSVPPVAVREDTSSTAPEPPADTGQPASAAPSSSVVEREEEPNNQFAVANAIAADTSITGTIQPAGDADWYGIDVADQGELQVRATAVPEGIGLQFRAWNSDKESFTPWFNPLRTGGLTEGVIDLPAPGRYWLEVIDDYHDASSQEPYTLQLAFTPTGDAAEPNNRVGTATEVAFDEPVLAAILPKGDADWYAVDVDDQGELQIHIAKVAEQLDIVVRVWDANHDVIQNWMAPLRKGGDTDGVADLPAAGRYFLEVTDNFNDERSPQPYEMTLAFVRAGDTYEPNNSFGKAATLELGKPVQAAMFPKGDVDWYIVKTGARGPLHIRISDVPPDLDIVCRVHNANREVVQNWLAPPRKGGDTEGTADLPEPGTYYLEVEDSFRDARAAQLYTLTVSAE